MDPLAPDVRSRLQQVCIGAFVLWSCFASSQAAPLPGYVLEWSDEFNGASLDLAKWEHRQPGPRWNAVNTGEAVAVTNGMLTITTYTQRGTHYTGMISTENKYMPRYGYFEARIDFNGAPGSWSTFWMQSPTISAGGSPHTDGTEMDIMEHRVADKKNKNISSQGVCNIHWDGYGADHKTVGSGLRGSNLGQGWHLYAVEWTPDFQHYFIDGINVWSVTNSVKPKPVPPAAPVAQRSEYIILSSEVRDADWAGKIPTSGYGPLGRSTNQMRVDWVRAYRLATPTGAQTSSRPSSP